MCLKNTNITIQEFRFSFQSFSENYNQQSESQSLYIISRGKKSSLDIKYSPNFQRVCTLSRPAQKGFSKLLGRVEAVQWRKLLAIKSDVCCLMVGFLLSITAKTSSLMFCSVVFRNKMWSMSFSQLQRTIKISH